MKLKTFRNNIKQAKSRIENGAEREPTGSTPVNAGIDKEQVLRRTSKRGFLESI